MTTEREITFDDVAETLLSCKWTFAKTMPNNPHEWTLRKTWPAEGVSFEDAVVFIRKRGRDLWFGRRKYTVLDLNGKRYWTMGAPLGDTILINRASNTGPFARKHPYDRIAPSYDELFRTPEADAENRAVFDLLGRDWTGKRVLDVGCGTGIFLEHCKIGQYHGVDPSRAMLDRLCEKHAGLADSIQLTPERMEHFWSPAEYDLVASTFGSPNYLKPSALERLIGMVKPGGKLFLMFYAPGYKPVTHIETNVDVPFYRHTIGTPDAEIGHFQILNRRRPE